MTPIGPDIFAEYNTLVFHLIHMCNYYTNLDNVIHRADKLVVPDPLLARILVVYKCRAVHLLHTYMYYSHPANMIDRAYRLVVD